MPEAMEVEEQGLDGDATDGADHRFKPLTKDLQEELEEGGDEVLREERERARGLIDALPLHK
jgi:N-acetyltransferase 10